MPQRIVQLTDLHFFTDPETKLKGVPTRDSFQQVWEFLLSREEEFEYLLFTGDLAHDEIRSTYLIIREQLEQWVPRMRILPGNHDHRGYMREVFPEITPGYTTDDPEEPLWFDVSVGNWRLLGLDSHVPGEVPGHMAESQLNLLCKTLSENTRPTMLFLHHPPVPVGTEWMDKIGLQNAEEFLKHVEANPHVQVICTGHVHHDHQGTAHQAAFYTTPATSVQFKPGTESPQGDHLPPGYRVFTLDGDSYTTEVVRVPELKYPPES